MFEMFTLNSTYAVSHLRKLKTDLQIVSSDRLFHIGCSAIDSSDTFWFQSQVDELIQRSSRAVHVSVVVVEGARVGQV